jgi:hypothetical protein
MGNYAGVDWASEKHDVLVCGEAGEKLLAATFAHDEAGLGALCRALVRAKVKQITGQIQELERQIADAIHAHPDGEIFLSFFRCSTSVVCAATPGPTSLPPSGWPATPSPTRRPAGPSAKRLTASRQPPTPSTLDTGRLAASVLAQLSKE